MWILVVAGFQWLKELSKKSFRPITNELIGSDCHQRENQVFRRKSLASINSLTCRESLSGQLWKIIQAPFFSYFAHIVPEKRIQSLTNTPIHYHNIYKTYTCFGQITRTVLTNPSSSKYFNGCSSGNSRMCTSPMRDMFFSSLHFVSQDTLIRLEIKKKRKAILYN